MTFCRNVWQREEMLLKKMMLMFCNDHDDDLNDEFCWC